MALISSWPAMMVRRLLRVTGLGSRLNSWLNRRGYEHRFHEALLGQLRNDDVVWDIGANVGVYTSLFADRVGLPGHVFAFEPSPLNRARLEQAVASRRNVTVIGIALGSDRSICEFAEGADSEGSDARIVETVRASPTDRIVQVEVVPGDSLIAERRVRVPSVVKIDVEGFEIEVLQGLSKTLRDPRVRSVCVEVHSAQTEERNITNAGRIVERLLQAAGFRVQWVDFSHIIARRPAGATPA